MKWFKSSEEEVTTLSKIKIRTSNPVLKVLALLLIALLYLRIANLYQMQILRVAVQGVQEVVTRMENKELLFILTGQQSYIDDYKYYRKSLTFRVNTLCRLLPASKGDRCKDLRGTIQLKVDAMDGTLDQVQAGKAAEVLAVVRSRKGLYLTHQIDASIERVFVPDEVGYCQY